MPRFSADTLLKIVRFNTSITKPSTHIAGLVYWNSDDGTLDTMTPTAGVVMQTGQELQVNVYNNSGVQIANGDAVYITGVNGGGLPAVAKAQADDPSTSIVLGLATAAIDDNSAGIVATFGLVRDLNTVAFAAGATVYLDADTAGEITDTIPDSPAVTVVIGTILVSDGSDGIVLVSVTQASIVSGTIQSKVYNLPLRGVLGADFYITGEFRTQSAGETGDYATDFQVSNQHIFLLVNTITGTGNVTITGTSIDETDGTPSVGDTEVIAVDATAAQYWQSTKKWWEVTNIDIPVGISAINYDVGVVGYTDFGNNDYKIVGYRIDAPSAGVNSELRFRIWKINDDGGGKMTVSFLEDFTVDASAGGGGAQVVDNLRSGGDDRSLSPATVLWADETALTLKQGDFDVYFSSDENVFESSSKDEGFILEIQDANNVSFVTLRLDYQLIG